ncbi:MAG: PilN domain-containing protein [Deltaproteobacteria bacterium]
MARGSGVIYMTDGLIRVGFQPEGQREGVREERMALTHSPDDCKRFAELLSSLKLRFDRLVLCVPRSRAILRFRYLPSHDDDELRKLAACEMDGLFPYRSEEFVSGYSVLERLPDGNSHVLFVAIQRQTLLWYLDFVKWGGVRPDEVWVSTRAVFNSFASSRDVRGTGCFIHVDDGFAELIFFKDRQIVYSRSVDPSSFDVSEIAVMAETLRHRGFVPRRLFAAGPDGGATLVDACREALACPVERMDGFSPLRGCFVRDDMVGIDLLPSELKADKLTMERRKSALVLGAVVLLNIILAFNIMFVRESSKRDYLAGLTKKIARMDVQTTALQKKLSRLRAYESLSESGKFKLELLSELATVCPGQVLLRSLDIAGERQKGTMMVEGRAQDADSVLRFASALKDTKLITSADVSYINKRPLESGGWVDFEIKALY